MTAERWKKQAMIYNTETKKKTREAEEKNLEK